MVAAAGISYARYCFHLARSKIVFWYAVVEPGQCVKVEIEEGNMLHLSLVSLGKIKKEKSNESINLFAHVGVEKLILSTLSPDKLPQQQLDLNFSRDFVVSHNWKNGTVFFYGYKADNPVKTDDDADTSDDSGSGEEDGGSTDEDEDDSDSDDSEEGEETSKKKVEYGKKRVAEVALKTPRENKKAKLITPQKTIVRLNSPQGWSELPPELLDLIAKCLEVEDLLVFRLVCPSWLSAVDNLKAKVSEVPFLMHLYVGEGRHKFYSLAKRKTWVTKRIPAGVLYIEYNVFAIFKDVGFGWVFASSNNGAVLYKPFCPDRTINLPRWNKLYALSLALLTANPSETINFMLLVHCATTDLDKDMGFWKNGDEHWNLGYASRNWFLKDMVLGRDGRIFLLYRILGSNRLKIKIWQVTDLEKFKKEIWSNSERPGVVLCYDIEYHPTCIMNLFLVESTDGELLVIRRYSIYRFSVMRLHLEGGICEEIDGLGNNAIFLGHNVSVAVDASKFPGVLKRNSIYFIENRRVPVLALQIHPKSGIYNVESSERFGFGAGNDRYRCQKLWMFPSF